MLPFFCMMPFPALAWSALLTGPLLLPLLPGAGYDLARAVQIMTLTLVALSLTVRPSRGWAEARESAFTKIALAIGLLISVTCAAVPLVALRELALLAGLIGLAQVARQQSAQLGFARALSLGLAAYGALYVVLLLLAMASGANVARLWLLLPGVENARYHDSVLTVALPLIAASLGSEPNRRWRAVSAWALVSGFLTLGVSAGRATALALAVAAALAWACGPQGRIVVRSLVAGAGAGALLHALLLVLLPFWLGVAADAPAALSGSDHGRLYLWQLALDQIAVHPWLGVGPMHLARMPNGKGAHPHNIYLQLAAEWGIPTTLLALAWVARRMGEGWRSRLHMQPVQLGAWLACAATLVEGAFAGNFVMPASQTLIALAWGVMLSALSRQTPASTGKVTRPGRAAGYALLASQLWLLSIAFPEAWLPEPRLLDTPNVQTPNDPVRRPRFWLQGWF